MNENEYKLAIATIKNQIVQFKALLQTAVEKKDYGKANNHAGFIEGLESALMYLGEFDYDTD